ncbi:MAG: NAD(P)-dependent oxidoreductase [Bryobacteraceae bacterium]
MKIAFIGTGNMGLPMARNLLRAGYTVTAYNRTPAHAEPLAKEGAVISHSLTEAVQGVEAVLTMLADDHAVEQMVEGFAPALPQGATHISMSTISVALSQKLAGLHEERRQGYLAAPVFGRPEAAAAANLWVVAAGPADLMDRFMPLFEKLSRGHSVVSDEPWLANTVKLAGNFLIAAMLESLGEAFALVRKSGVDAAQFLEIVNSALFQSPIYGNYGNIIAKQKFEPAGFKLRLGFKDLRLAQEAAQNAAVPMPVAGILRDRYLDAIANGESEIDWSAIARLAARAAGL